MPLNVADLRQVGEFSNHYLNKRHLIRSPKNPMDKCTIVSILQKDIFEVKFTIEPGKFHIPPGTYENPSTLVVGSSSWWREIDVEQPMLEIPNSSIQVAESVIKDYANGLVGCNMEDAMPGLFFVLGEVKVADIKIKYKESLDVARTKQNKWFEVLISLADSLWANSNGNPLSIANEMRLAARELGLDTKPWLKDFQISQMVKCFACGGLRNPDFPVCPTCRAIDPNHPLAKDLKFA